MELRSRLADVDGGTLRSLLVGDLLALSVFLVAGEIRHGIDPLAAPGRVVLVALPFLLGWVVFGSLAGAYSADLLDSPGGLVVTTLVGWFLGDAAGQALRATAIFPGDAAPTFFAVAFAFGGALLLVHRVARLLLRRFAA